MSTTAQAELASVALYNLHRRLEVARPGAPVALTSRCCHPRPGERESLLLAEHSGILHAERRALARVAAWARRHGYAVETRSHGSHGLATSSPHHGDCRCSAYDALIVRRSA